MYLAIMCHYHNEQYLHISSIEGWAYQTMVRIGYNENNQYVIFSITFYLITHFILTCTCNRFINIHTIDIMILKNQGMPYF